MTASMEAQEDLENIEAFVEDLILASSDNKKRMSQMAKSWVFGPSLSWLSRRRIVFRWGWFGFLVERQFGARPKPNEAVVFKDFFSCSLRIPSIYFLCVVLETFKV